MKPFLAALILLGLFSCSEERTLNEKLLDTYLFHEVYLKPENVDIWKAYTMQVVKEMTQQKVNKLYITYQINDTVFYIIEELQDYSLLNMKTSTGLHKSLGTEYLSSIDNVKSGLTVLDKKLSTSVRINDIKNDGQHALFEVCYIKPEKTSQAEENWLEWLQLHDSLETGLKYMVFSGRVGYNNPFYMVLFIAPDSIAMKMGFSKLWDEGKVKANELFQKEIPYYRKYENFSGTLIEELSYIENSSQGREQ